jgi:hypothetical protein
MDDYGYRGNPWAGGGPGYGGPMMAGPGAGVPPAGDMGYGYANDPRSGGRGYGADSMAEGYSPGFQPQGGSTPPNQGKITSRCQCSCGTE